MTNDTNQANNAIETKNEKSIGIHCIGLEARELAIFDRVVAFNITHGLVAHKTNDIEEAELIVINQKNYSEIEASSDTNKSFLMVCDTLSNENVEAQIQRPLLITKVMNILGEAIESVQQKRLSLSVETEQQDHSFEVDLSVNLDHHTDVDTIVDNSFTTQETITENKEVIEDAVLDVVNTEEVEKSDVEMVSEEKSEDTMQKGHHALVIDDSASIRKQLELELRDAGISSDFAESGEDALEKVKEGQFDLIFLDIIMPGIDGYETCKQMRAIAEYKKTPIIMLSGKTSPLDEVQGVIAGATTYLTKPVKSDKLQETLNRVTKWIDNFSKSKKTEIA